MHEKVNYVLPHLVIIFFNHCLFIISIPLRLTQGPIWRKAGPFWLPGSAGSPQCHPQASAGEKPDGRRAQRRRFRLRHQLLWDRPRQPGQFPALTPKQWWTQKWGQRWKAKGTFFCFVCSGGVKSQKRMQHLCLGLWACPGVQDWKWDSVLQMLQRGRKWSSSPHNQKIQHHPLVRCWLIWLGAVCSLPL